MKRAIAICMSALFLVLMYSLVLNVYGITIEQGNKDLVLYCHNATNGKLLGTTATINATNSASAVSLATQVMTNQNTGKFNITVNLAPDTYTLQIDCGHADNLDYTRILYVDNRREGLVANAVNTSTASSATIVTAGTVSDKTGYTVSTVQDKTGYTVSTVQDKMGYGLTGNAVNSSTLSATGTTVATATSVTNGVTVTTNNDKTGYTVSTVQDKTGYTVSTVQDKNGYSLAPNAVNSTTLAASAVGAINGSIGQVTGAVGSVTSGVTVTTNNDKTGYSLTTSDWVTDSDLTPITTALSGNASNWFTSTYQTRLDAAITTRSSHSAADVDALISDEQIQAALDQNASNWFTTSFQNTLNSANGALSGNASNWFTSTYQTRVDAAISSRSSHSAADVWTSATRTLTAFAFNIGLLPNAVNDTTVSATARVGLIGTAVNTSTAVNLDAAISTRSSHSAADVDNLIADEVIQGAIDGNSSLWAATTSTTGLATSSELATTSSVVNKTSVGLQQNGTIISRIIGAIDGNATGWAATTSVAGLATSSELATTSTVVNNTNAGLKQNGTLISRIAGALDNNATNWFTGTYQTRLDAAISSRSSHSAADVDNLIDDEGIAQALTGNATNWFTSLYQGRVDAAISSRASAANLDSNTSTILANFVTVTNNQDTIDTHVKEVNTTTRAIKGAIDGNASNWFTSLYQGRIDATISSRSSHAAADIWSVASRTLTNFGLVALNSSGIQSLTQNISYNLSTDHGAGEWNNTYVTSALSSGDKNEIIRGAWQNVSSNLTADHSAGNWSDKNTVATSTLIASQILNATATCTGYGSASLGCIVESIEKFTR